MNEKTKIFILFLFISCNSFVGHSQLNKFLIMTYFEEGSVTSTTVPWRSSIIARQDSFFRSLKDSLNFNCILFFNASKGRDYYEFYKKANDFGMSTMSIHDSLYSRNQFNIEKGLSILTKFNTALYNNIGFHFADEPITHHMFLNEASLKPENFIEDITDFSKLVTQYNPNLLRYANLSPTVNFKDIYYRENYIQKYINLTNPNLLSFDLYPQFYPNFGPTLFRTLYDFATKSVENGIPFIYVLTPLKDSIDYYALGQQLDFSKSAKSDTMLSYLIYASLAYGAKGIAYWPGFEWIVNNAIIVNNESINYTFALKHNSNSKKNISILHNKLEANSDIILNLNFLSAYHKSDSSFIGIQAGSNYENMHEFASWENITNDKYANEIFLNPEICILDENRGLVPKEIAVTFMRENTGKIYFWVFNKSIKKSQNLIITNFTNDFKDVLNNSIITDKSGQFPKFTLKPGEAKLLTTLYQLEPFIEYSIDGMNYSGDSHLDNDRFYPFETADRITLQNDTFQSNSTKSFIAHKIILKPGVRVKQGSTTRFVSYKNMNTIQLPYNRYNVKNKKLIPSNIDSTSNRKLLSHSILKIFPNPNNGIFNYNIFTNENFDNNFDLYIYNISGKLVLKTNKKEHTSSINLTMLKPGVYLLKVVLNGEVLVNKVTIY